MTGGSPLYESDPEAWYAHLAAGNATQARKRVSGDALIFDQAGRMLLVNPGYKPGWDLPGGMAEANESPADCVRREVREELGLNLSLGQVLCIEWVPPHGPWDDLIAFVFYGGTLSAGLAAAIRLLDGELEGFEFCNEGEAAEKLRPRAWARAAAALAAWRSGTLAYLQDGHPLGFGSGGT
jgi:ADP-ribose pyrophosphatase YjhB (NUDIX family)